MPGLFRFVMRSAKGKLNVIIIAEYFIFEPHNAL